jgi:hypothetical protein
MSRYVRSLAWLLLVWLASALVLAGCRTGPRAGRGKPFAGSSAGTVLIYGNVMTPLEVDLALMREIGPVKIVAEHPIDGAGEFEGVRISDLLARVEKNEQCTCSAVAFQAADGRWAEIRVLDFYMSPDALLVPTGDAYDLVMPGLKAHFWLKDVRKIEIK